MRTTRSESSLRGDTALAICGRAERGRGAIVVAGIASVALVVVVGLKTETGPSGSPANSGQQWHCERAWVLINGGGGAAACIGLDPFLISTLGC